LESAADARDPDWQLMEHRTIADELVRAKRGERRYRIDVRDVPGLCESGRDPDHVLLSDPNVEEPSRESLRERLQHREPQIAGQHDIRRVVRGATDELAAEGGSHPRGSSSATACR